MTKRLAQFSTAGDPTTWDAQEWMTITDAVELGVPQAVIEAAWREADEQLGTNCADDLIRKHFS